MIASREFWFMAAESNGLRGNLNVIQPRNREPGIYLRWEKSHVATFGSVHA